MDTWAAILYSGELRSPKLSWTTHKGSSSYSDCFSPKRRTYFWRTWKCHSQSLVLTVSLICTCVCYQVSDAFIPQQHGVFPAGDETWVKAFWTESTLHLDGLGPVKFSSLSLQLNCAWDHPCISTHLSVNLCIVNKRLVNASSSLCQNDHENKANFFKSQTTLKIWKAWKETPSFYHFVSASYLK